jgi:hypothetical protein
MELDRVNRRMNQAEGEVTGWRAGDELIEHPAGGSGGGKERCGLVDGLLPDGKDLACERRGMVGETLVG